MNKATSHCLDVSLFESGLEVCVGEKWIRPHSLRLVSFIFDNHRNFAKTIFILKRELFILSNTSQFQSVVVKLLTGVVIKK